MHHSGVCQIKLLWEVLNMLYTLPDNSIHQFCNFMLLVIMIKKSIHIIHLIASCILVIENLCSII